MTGELAARLTPQFLSVLSKLFCEVDVVTATHSPA